MSVERSISQLLTGFRAGDEAATERLWTRYANRLAESARLQLGDAPRRVSDEEDIAQSVFGSICRGAMAGRFQDIQNRDELWWLLMAISKRKVVDYIRRETALKRGAGRVQTVGSMPSSDSADDEFTLDQLVGDAPTPDVLAMLDEQGRHLLGKLRDDRLRQIAVRRIEGYTVPEIADELGVGQRSVERKLQLIRKTWARELNIGR